MLIDEIGDSSESWNKLDRSKAEQADGGAKLVVSVDDD